jgi:hypothetical protein
MSKHRNPRPKVPKQPPTDNPPRRLTKTAIVAVENALDELRQVIARTAASVYATEELFTKILWDDRTDERDEDRRNEHLSLLIETTKAAAMEAVQMGEELSSDLFRLRTARREVRS